MIIINFLNIIKKTSNKLDAALIGKLVKFITTSLLIQFNNNII